MHFLRNPIWHIRMLAYPQIFPLTSVTIKCFFSHYISVYIFKMEAGVPTQQRQFSISLLFPNASNSTINSLRMQPRDFKLRLAPQKPSWMEKPFLQSHHHLGHLTDGRLQWALHKMLLKPFWGTAGTECSGKSSDAWATLCLCNTTALWAALDKSGLSYTI